MSYDRNEYIPFINVHMAERISKAVRQFISGYNLGPSYYSVTPKISILVGRLSLSRSLLTVAGSTKSLCRAL